MSFWIKKVGKCYAIWEQTLCRTAAIKINSCSADYLANENSYIKHQRSTERWDCCGLVPNCWLKLQTVALSFITCFIFINKTNNSLTIHNNLWRASQNNWYTPFCVWSADSLEVDVRHMLPVQTCQAQTLDSSTWRQIQCCYLPMPSWWQTTTKKLLF